MQKDQQNINYQKTIEQQRIASDPFLNSFVSANAGSGKTRVLIDRVTRILLSGTRPEKILCVTYTKAAASEMQTRLFDRLSQWAVADDHILAQEFQELGIEYKDFSKKILERQLQDRYLLSEVFDTDKHQVKSELFQSKHQDVKQIFAMARQLFARALETPGGLKIQTIHSFCERILRRFPVEAGISPDFLSLNDQMTKEIHETVKTKFSECVFDQENSEKSESSAKMSLQQNLNAQLAYQYLNLFYSYKDILEILFRNMEKANQIKNIDRETIYAFFNLSIKEEKLASDQNLLPEKYAQIFEDCKSIKGEEEKQKKHSILEKAYHLDQKSKAHQKTKPVDFVESMNTFLKNVFYKEFSICQLMPLIEDLEQEDLIRKSAENSLNRKQINLLKSILSSISSKAYNRAFELYQKFFFTNENTLRKKLFTDDAFEFSALKDLYDSKTGQETLKISVLSDKFERIKSAQKTDAFYRLLILFRSLYEQEKAKLRGLDFFDLIEKTSFLLTETSVSEWIRYKLDGGIEHILVDESQDTNPLQWQILLTIADEFFNQETEYEKSFFAVGDEKQSIYSFHGAQPEAFLNAGERIKQKARQNHRRFEMQNLLMSFRSKPEILNFVDTLFSQDEIKKKISQYGEIKPHHAFREPGGSVEWWPLALSPEKNEKPGYLPPIDSPPLQNAPLRLAIALTKKIQGWLGIKKTQNQDGFDQEIKEKTVCLSKSKSEIDGLMMIKEEEKTRPLRPGDIMILVRSRQSGYQFYHLMIQTLKRYHLPVAGFDQVQLGVHPAIQDLLSLGKSAMTHQDDLSLAEVLKGPFFDCSEQDLYEIAGPKKQDLENGKIAYILRRHSLWSCLKDRKDTVYQKITETLSNLKDKALIHGAYDFFAWFLNQKNVKGGSNRKALYRRFGVECEDPIDLFLNKAMKAQFEQGLSLRVFLQEFVSKEDEEVIKREMDDVGNVIRVMTVHGAKGLEAPVVILPDTTGFPNSSGKEKNARFVEVRKQEKQHELRKSQIIKTNSSILQNLQSDYRINPVYILLSTKGSDKRSKQEERLLQEQKMLQYNEYLRVFYVALTRARDKLLICGFQSKRTKNQVEKNWHELAKKSFESIKNKRSINTEFGEGILYSSSLSHLKPDEREPKKKKQEDKETESVQSVIDQTNTQQKKRESEKKPVERLSEREINILQKKKRKSGAQIESFPKWVYRDLENHAFVKKQIIMPSSPDLNHPFNMGDIKKDSFSPLKPKSRNFQFKRGLVIHKLLEKLPELESEKRIRSAQRILKKEYPDLSDKNQEKIINQVISILDHPKNALLFNHSALVEQSISGIVEVNSEQIQINAKIDRLVFHKNQVLIIDYKTNQNPPESEDSTPLLYKQQLALYRLLLKKLYPKKQIKTYILWTETMHMMMLSEENMELAIQQLSSEKF